jgi:hypothetical protein
LQIRSRPEHARRDDAVAARQEAEERLRDALVIQDGPEGVPGAADAHARSSRPGHQGPSAAVVQTAASGSRLTG